MHHHQRQSWARAFILSGILSIGILHGCNVGTYNTDVTLNGTRKIEQKLDGVIRKIETNSPVVFENGAITQLPSGAVLKIQEVKDGETRRAELREKEGRQELFIAAGNSFRKSTPEEKAWFQTFLKSMDLEDREKSEIALINLLQVKSSFGEALQQELEELNKSDKSMLLKAIVLEFDLTPSDQVIVAETVLDGVTFASDQTDILLALIQRPDFAVEAEQSILNRIEDISLKSNQEKIEDALKNKSILKPNQRPTDVKQ